MRDTGMPVHLATTPAISLSGNFLL